MNGPEVEEKRFPGFAVCLFLALAMLLVMLPANAVGVRLFSHWHWYGVIFGVTLMLAAIPLHRAGKRWKPLYLLALLFNGFGNGFSLSALYIHAKLNPDILSNLPGMIPAACVLTLCVLLLWLLSERKDLAVILSAIAALAALVLCVVLMIRTSGAAAPQWRFAFFAALLAAVFLLPMGQLAARPERSVLRDSSLAGFGAFVLITLVVVLLLSEGEVLDGLDIGDVFSGGSARKKQPRVRK